MILAQLSYTSRQVELISLSEFVIRSAPWGYARDHVLADHPDYYSDEQWYGNSALHEEYLLLGEEDLDRVLAAEPRGDSVLHRFVYHGHPPQTGIMCLGGGSDCLP